MQYIVKVSNLLQRFSHKSILASAFVLIALVSHNASAQFPIGFPDIQSIPRSNPTRVSVPVTEIDPTRQDNLDPKEKLKQDSLRAERELEMKADKEKLTFRKKIFGHNIFNNPNIKFDPNLNMATPRGYVLGAGDKLNIYVYGYSETNISPVISPDGFINIPKVGNVQVSGLTIEEARSRVAQRMKRYYADLGSQTSMEMYLGTPRSIRITVQGEVIAPGTYSISSLATVLNAMYLAGGPNENGSYRNIKVIRQNRVIATLDLYEYLITGIQKNDVRLQDNDNIVVSLYETRVEMTGRFKRPGIFEILASERLDKAISFAGGFSPGAFSGMVKITRFTDRQVKILDVSTDIYSSFSPTNGDIIDAETVLLTRFENQVNIEGAVFRPGKYSVNENPTLTRLIQRVESFREDAFLERIVITRTKDDLTKENISVNYKDIMNGKAPDVALKREDVITVSSAIKLREEYTVRITGEVNLDSLNGNGVFPYANAMTVEDLLVRAGGLRESAASARVIVSRRKKTNNITDANPEIAEVYSFAINKDLKYDENASKFILEPFDEVIVYASPNYTKQQSVKIQGQVLLVGDYVIQSREEKLSSIIKRAGGLTPQAYLEGASLIRRVKLSKIELENRRKTLEDAAQATSDGRKTSVKTDVVEENTEERIGIDLADAIKNPEGINDLILQDGDVISIPKMLQTVRVQGQVLYPNSVSYQNNASLSDYIAAAGGFTAKSNRKRVFVVYANGSADRTRSFLFFKKYPRIKPGAEIVVPEKTITETTPGQVAATVQAIAFSVTTIVGVIGLITR
jgi:protein involved in polysaccharide export with SLBB domain